MDYFDYAATTPLASTVKKSMEQVMDEDWGNPSSAHQIGRKAKEIVDGTHKTIANFCGVLPSEVLLTGSGTESINLALHSLAEQWIQIHKTPGTFITSPLEHKAVSEPLRYLQKQGWNILEIPLHTNGQINTEYLIHTIESNTITGITIQWVNSEFGIIQPIEEIAAIALQHSIPFHCDASQGVPLLPWPSILPDLISFTPHKFYGPKGIGVLIAKKHIPIIPQIYGGGQEYGYRSGTENCIAIAGLCAAIKLLQEKKQSRYEHAKVLEKHLISQLQIMNNIKRSFITDYCAPSILNLQLKNVSSEIAVMQCDLQRKCISAGSACTTGAKEISRAAHTLKINDGTAYSTIRVSTGEQTTIEQLTELLFLLEGLKN